MWSAAISSGFEAAGAAADARRREGDVCCQSPCGANTSCKTFSRLPSRGKFAGFARFEGTQEQTRDSNTVHRPSAPQRGALRRLRRSKLLLAGQQDKTSRRVLGATNDNHLECRQ